ncbi:hypothetical protein CHU92_01480, partial [Flavobacterium cyanobacteriorum]
MKNIIVYLCFVFSAATAQNLPVLSTTSLNNPFIDFEHWKKGNYAKDTGNTRDQYVGTWQYSQGNTVFQVRIFKQDQVLFDRVFNGQVEDYGYLDCVILKYRLVKNGVVIFDNLASTSYNTDES